MSESQSAGDQVLEEAWFDLRLVDFGEVRQASEALDKIERAAALLGETGDVGVLRA